MKIVLFVCVVLSVLATSTMFAVVSTSKDIDAERSCETEGTVVTCQGGGAYRDGDRHGGSGGRGELDLGSGEFTNSGGYAIGGTGDHGGYHCEGVVNDEQSTTCVGSEEFRTSSN